MTVKTKPSDKAIAGLAGDLSKLLGEKPAVGANGAEEAKRRFGKK